jgi:hypothetical protein
MNTVLTIIHGTLSVLVRGLIIISEGMMYYTMVSSFAAAADILDDRVDEVIEDDTCDAGSCDCSSTLT